MCTGDPTPIQVRASLQSSVKGVYTLFYETFILSGSFQKHDLLLKTTVVESFMGKHCDIPKPDARCNFSSMSCPGPPRHAQNTSCRKCRGDILVRFLNHLSWFLLMWRCSSCTVSTASMTALRT